MGIFPYVKTLPICLESLKKQTLRNEVIVSEHAKEDYIRLNYLLNKGVEKASNEWLFFCNADFRIPMTLLQDMFDAVFLDDYEVIFPMYRGKSKKLKMSDGSYFISKSLLRRFGLFDESLIGISRATFIFVDWALKNTRWHSSKDFQFEIIDHVSPKNKLHKPTYEKCKPIYRSVINRLKEKKLWLV